MAISSAALRSEPESLGTVVSDKDSPNFESFRFKAKPDQYVKPGVLVATPVRESGRLLLGRVVGSVEVNPHESPTRVTTRDVFPEMKAEYPGEGVSTSIYRVYEAQILECLDGRAIVPPEDMPQAGAPVFLPDDDVFFDASGLIPDPDGGLHIGQTAFTLGSGKPAPVVLKREAIQRHFFIGGATGTGKSYGTGVLIEEVHKHGIPVIIFDSQDEYAAMTEDLGGKTLAPGVDYWVKLSSLTDRELVDLIPTLSTDQQRDTVAMAFLELKKRKRDFNVTTLCAEIDSLEDRMGKTSHKGVASARVRASLEKVRVLGGETPWSDIIRPRSVVNIGCSGLMQSELQLVIAATLRELQGQRVAGAILPFMVVLDEAHLFVPENDWSPSKQIIREMVRIGRHFGICVVLITQSPIDIDKKVIRQCNTRLVFALEPDQLDTLKGIKADAPKELFDRLPKLPRGTCLVSGTYETIRHATLVAIRQRSTTHGGHAPDIFSELGPRSR
jgi:DNA helicase HerA-like ATPase